MKYLGAISNDYDMVNKKYVDDAVAGAGGSAGMVKLTYGQAMPTTLQETLYTQLYVNNMPCCLITDDDGVGRYFTSDLYYMYVDE